MALFLLAELSNALKKQHKIWNICNLLFSQYCKGHEIHKKNMSREKYGFYRK